MNNNEVTNADSMLLSHLKHVHETTPFPKSADKAMLEGIRQHRLMTYNLHVKPIVNSSRNILARVDQVFVAMKAYNENPGNPENRTKLNEAMNRLGFAEKSLAQALGPINKVEEEIVNYKAIYDLHLPQL